MRTCTFALGFGLATLCSTVHAAAPEAETSVDATPGADSAKADSPAPDPDVPSPASDPASDPAEAQADGSADEDPADENPVAEDPAAEDPPAPELDEDTAAELEAAEDEAAELEAVEDEAADPDESSDTPEPDGDGAIRPPRFDGPYLGVVVYGTANFPKLIDLATPSPLIGTSGFIQAGDAVFPWMSIGVTAGGGAAWAGDQQMFEGALLVEFGFVPLVRYPFSIRAGFGFGGGAVSVSDPDVPRGGFGGAVFKGAARYEFFPLAERKRPTRGGGWAIGPELGWLGATPAGPGQPFVNTVLLGLSTSFYFGS